MINEKLVFKSSAQYWNDRYERNLTSGAGSYGKLARFKAEFLNSFVRLNEINEIIEFGCGDGNQLELAEYPQYTGFDVAEKSIEICSRKFAFDNSKEFFLLNCYVTQTADLTLSLDVIYHLIEEDVFLEHIDNLFSASRKFAVIYSSNDFSLNSGVVKHVKHRRFTDVIKKRHGNNWRLLGVVPNKYPFDGSDHKGTSFSDFYVYAKLPR